MTTRQLHDYQYDAVIHLSRQVALGSRTLGLASPTGSGKTLTLHAFLRKNAHVFNGAVIAAPSIAIEDGFYRDERISYTRGVKGRTEAISWSVSRSMFLRPREADVDAKQHLKRVLSPNGHVRSPYFLTTHMQLSRWGKKVLPSGEDALRGKILVVDEAHHAGTNDEDVRYETKFGSFTKEWLARGGTVLYATATPFRTDDQAVFPEGTVPYVRTFAEHAASPWAPSNFRPVTVIVDREADNANEFFGKTVSAEEERTGLGAQSMVDQWVKDGCPKAVFIVPGGKDDHSKKWADRLVTALKEVRPQVRVVDGVGDDPETKAAFRTKIQEEKEVRRFCDSRVDVFLSCKRFDEGTDWPLCSHVYNWGIPRSFGLVVQRAGRAFRDKKVYPDYPPDYVEHAVLTFFMLKVKADTLDQFERQHREHSLLLACYLADFNTATEYRGELRMRTERAWSRRPDEEEVRDDDSEAARIEEELATKTSELVRSQVLARMATLEGSLGRPATQGEVIEYLAKLGISDEEWTAADNILRERLSGEDREEFDRKLRERMPVYVSRPELRKAFIEVLAEFKDRTVPVLDEVVVFYTKITGESAQQVAGRLKDYLVKPPLTIESLKSAILHHRNLNGEWPSAFSGDATQDFGYSETWGAVNSALMHGLRGFDGTSSIYKFRLEHGLTDRPAVLSREALIRAGESYKRRSRLQRWPSAAAGDATEDFGFPITWEMVEGVLRRGGMGFPGGSSLSSFWKAEVGRQEKRELSDALIQVAVNAYVAEHGRMPHRDCGDASKYFGFPETWKAVEACLRIGRRGVAGGRGIGDFGPKKPDLTLDMIRHAVEKFKSAHGRNPYQKSGDATPYFGFQERWDCVDSALRDGLRSLPKGSSLSAFCLGSVPKKRAPRGVPPSLDAIARAAQAFSSVHGRRPSYLDDDAAEWFGHPASWRSINKYLDRQGSSLAKFCKSVGI